MDIYREWAICLVGMIAVMLALVSMDAKAAEEFYKGGRIVLHAESMPKDIWVYKNKSGRISVEDNSARFEVKKGTLRVSPSGKFRASEEGTTILNVKMRGKLRKQRAIHIIPYPRHFSLSARKKSEKLPSQDMKMPMTTEICLKGETPDKRLLKVEAEPIQIGEPHIYVDPFLSAPKAAVKKDRIKLTAEYPGNYKVNVSYAGVTKKFRWNLAGIRCNPSGILLAPGDKEKIKVTGVSVNKFE